MTYENNKSLILFILVVTSVILTWNLWTYQPDYDTMENANNLQEVELSERKDIGKIIKPNKIIYHFEYSHFGTTNSVDIEKILQEVDNWEFYDIEDITDEVSNLSEFAHSKGNVEIVFPDEIPFEFYKNLLNIEDRKTPQFTFNRIVIDVEDQTKDGGNVYFIEYGNPQSNKVFASHIKPSEIKKFYNQYFRVTDGLAAYFPYPLSNDQTIFLPENQTNITSYKYFQDRLDPDKFKAALFSDPSFVQKNVVDNNIEYSDSRSMMVVNNDSMILTYINPEEESDKMVGSKDLLQKSIEFVNDHGGWTGKYQYASIDKTNQKVSFRLYDNNGFPIFNDNGLAEIVQVWGKNEVYKYIRPTLVLDVPLRMETTEVTLDSAREILEFIKKKKGFKPELLDDLVIGYTMEKDPNEPQLINLEPFWFYRYGHTWIRITEADLGGVKRGLE